MGYGTTGHDTTAILARTGTFALVSRSKFSDVWEMLEGGGIVALSASTSAGALPAGSPWKLVHTASFAMTQAPISFPPSPAFDPTP
ncbi:hypothetical protein FIBSPDRAFT_1049308 [Athelia psychrophila]|uniref:Uncharacterized protein n=1 Tax=Athelia psychrophila TaxID=1759441 RepID=A0A166CFG5_9AGAM|nr:hypothetical protein FIBSPDRAFT_1049308 [Fibularhizoctonia sp. CBS 109695]